MGLDLWEYDLRTGEVRNLTNSPTQYDEHARYSPDGRQLVVAQQPLWNLQRGKESPNRSWLVTLPTE
jgi:Tol biopolymer transport system component